VVGSLHLKLSVRIVPVADRLNHLLAGLEESFQRERQFGTAVAHELRTPIAGLRSTVEVGLRHARPEASYRATLAASLPLISHLQRMVETLLLLGGLDRGQMTAQRRAVDLIPIMRRAWAPLDELALDGGLRLSWDLGRAAPVVTDPDLIAIVVANALQNLVEYATPRSTATVRFTPGASGWSLSFANPAQGLDPSDAERAFDRFWRGDASRTGTGQHCGLGLALCRSIVGHLGGGIAARVDEGRFVLTVTGVAGRASSVESQMNCERECAHHALTEYA
jgi:two-component system heavy metal sensor histidine kinase CusS